MVSNKTYKVAWYSIATFLFCFGFYLEIDYEYFSEVKDIEILIRAVNHQFLGMIVYLYIMVKELESKLKG